MGKLGQVLLIYISLMFSTIAKSDSVNLAGYANLDMLKLIANDNKELTKSKVAITGVLSLGFENTKVFVNKESFDLELQQRSIYLDLSAFKRMDLCSYSGEYVTIYGDYQAVDDKNVIGFVGRSRYRGEKTREAHSP